LDNATAAAVSQDASIATNNLFGREEETTLKYIAGTPMFVSGVSIASTTTPSQYFHMNDTYPATFDGYLSFMFTQRTGGYKCKSYISCTTLHCAKFVFYLAPSTAGTSGEWQYCNHRIVDVAGPTEVEIMVPELCQGYTKLTSNTTWALWVECLAYSAPLGSATPILFMNYQAAAEDVAYFDLIETQVTFTPQSNPRDDFRKKFTPLREGDKMYEHDGIVTGTYTNILEMMKLKTCMLKKGSGTAVSLQMPTVPTWGGSNVLYGPDVYLVLFQFWKGSVSYKFGTSWAGSSAQPGDKLMLYLTNRVKTTPYADFVSDAVSVAEIRAPYQTPYSMVSTRLPSSFDDTTRFTLHTGAGGQGCVWCGFSDDFRVSHLMWPPWSLTQGNVASTTYGMFGASGAY